MERINNEICMYERGRQSFRSRELRFVHKAELSRRCNSSERKRPYSRVLYLVLLDTFFESESVTKNKSHFWADLLPWKNIHTIQNKQSSVTSIKRLCARCGNRGNG
jgi:hypothetical protein